MLQFIINGLITGVLYSLLAIGFALVYNTTKVFHIAAAALYVFAAYMLYWLSVRLGLHIFIAALLSVILTMGLSLLMDLSVYRPLQRRNASGNVAMIASIGMMTVVINVLSMLFGNETKVVRKEALPDFAFLGAGIPTPELLLAAIGGGALLLFLVFLGTGSFGIRIRALSADRPLCETSGYDTAATRSVVFLLSGAFIALASCLRTYDMGLDVHMGMDLLITSLVAMILGGIGRFGTCVIGGLVLGVLQAGVTYLFQANWGDAVTFTLLLILLFLRPQGIAGYKQRTV